MSAAKKSNKAAKSNVAALVRPESNAPMVAPQSFGKFKVSKQVTLPTFKITVGMPLVIQVTGAMYEGKEIKQTAGETKRDKPATIMPCNRINPETGEIEVQGQIVVGTVLAENLNEAYKDGSYVGKLFALNKIEKKDGKRYHEYQILELSAE